MFALSYLRSVTTTSARPADAWRSAAARPAPAALAALAALALISSAAYAQMLPVPQNVVTLNSSASIEVNKDWLSVTLSTTREGTDAAAVQAHLKQALDAALAEARKAARPGQVEVQTGAFSLYPRYAPATPQTRGQPAINGWQGSTELIVEGRDMQAIAQLTGRINTLTIGRVTSSLSREARQKVEADVAALAIARFRANAEIVSKQFGFGGYTVREVAVNADLPQPPQPMMRMQAMAAPASDAALPVEAGKAVVTATVNGSVQMK